MSLWKILIIAGFLALTACSKSDDKSPTPDPKNSQNSSSDSSTPESNSQPPSAEVPQTDNPNDTAPNTPVESDQLIHLKKSKRIWINLQGDLPMSNGGDANALTWSNQLQSDLFEIRWLGNSFAAEGIMSLEGQDEAITITGKVAEDGASLIELHAVLTITKQTNGRETVTTQAQLDIQNFPIRQWPRGGKSDIGVSLSGIQLKSYFRNLDYVVTKHTTDGNNQKISLTKIDFQSSTLTIFFGAK